ncbi:MAG: SLBB domain-containing protein [Bacteroidetes bacterium]|nr:SLBB domain-containing protein [Bacteroidota bacterium]
MLAQGKHSRTIVGTEDTQASYIFSGYDLSNFNTDQLSDDDLNNIKSKLQSRNISYDQAEQMAVKKGMAPAEAQRLKARLMGLSSKGAASNTNVSPDTSVSSTRTGQGNSYLSYRKPKSALAVFGSSFFNNPSLSFEPNLRIATPVNYVLGPDDELLITVYGYQEAVLRAIVQPEGTIFLPQVGTIPVAGLTIEQATALLRTKMGQTAYRSIKSGLSTVIIALDKIKSIHITVVGAAKPGNYTVSSVSTVFNSLYACGGPGDINTYRYIELIRNNKILQKIDLYQFLTKGDQRGNVPLKESDVINFPVYNKRVTILGQVKRPGIFELKDNETLQDLLFFAGGYTDRAYKTTIKVLQITDVERRIRDLSKADMATYQPSNGDVFEVDSVLNRVVNGVAVKGAVHRPGEFELVPGLTVSGLIKRAGGLDENVFTQRANLTRRHDDGTKENITFNVTSIMDGNSDIKLVKGDTVNIAFSNDLRTSDSVTVEGEVRKPGEFGFRQNLTLKDALLMAGGLTDAASSFNIEVGRRIVNQNLQVNVDSIAKVYNINIRNGLEIDDNKFVLEPFDIITVRRNPGYSEQQKVLIKGEVNFPGSYTIESKNERISSLIKRSGGLSPLANKEGVFLIRISAGADTSKNQDVKNIEASTKDKKSEKIILDVNKVNDRIAINLDEVLKDPGSIDDYVLQDGDVIQVSKIDPLVKVTGEVLSSNKTGYVKGEPLDYYLTQAGGTTDDARRSKIYVVHSNGSVSRTKNGFFGIFRSYPRVDAGAEIIVPGKKERRDLSTGEVIGLSSTVISLISVIIVTIAAIKK